METRALLVNRRAARQGAALQTQPTRPVLVIGFRFNQNIGTKEIKSEAELVEFGKTAKAFQANAEDYFLFSRGAVDWQAEIAQFVVGRPAYDNWLVDHAVHEKKVDVIDATKTIRAIHQTVRAAPP
eukprot:1807122-Rhodomonas_salina.3